MIIFYLLCFLIVKTQNCDKDKELFYKGACVDISCFDNQLERSAFNFVDYSNIQNLQNSITIGISPLAVQEYLISFYFDDKQDDPLLFNQKECIDFRVYLNNNDYSVDNARKFVDQYGAIPTWPQSQNKWNAQYNVGEIFFALKTNLLNEYGCIEFKSQNKTSWDCFVELAFVIRRQTVFSYISNLRFTQYHLGQSEDTLKITKLFRNKACYIEDEEQNCYQPKYVESQLLFCANISCQVTSIMPLTNLTQNAPLYMIHIINDEIYKSQQIMNDTIVFQSMGVYVFYYETMLNIIDRQQGQTIYQLKIPMTSEYVYVTSKGYLERTDANNKTRFLQKQKQMNKLIVTQTILAGNVYPSYSYLSKIQLIMVIILFFIEI